VAQTGFPRQSHYKSFQTESKTKYMLTTINTHSEATQRVMTAKLTRLTHKIAIQLHLAAEICTIYNFHSRQPVRKLWGFQVNLLACLG